MSHEPVALQERTTYRRHDGELVHIAGRTRGAETIEGLPVFWSIGGDWYLIDGRFVGGALSRAPGQPVTLTRFAMGASDPHSIAEEAHDPAWWEGVKT